MSCSKARALTACCGMTSELQVNFASHITNASHLVLYRAPGFRHARGQASRPRPPPSGRLERPDKWDRDHQTWSPPRRHSGGLPFERAKERASSLVAKPKTAALELDDREALCKVSPRSPTVAGAARTSPPTSHSDTNRAFEAEAMVEGSLPSPFPPLSLSDDEKQSILNKVNELLSESLAGYEQFLVQDRATVSELQWKPVTKRDGLSAYRKRSVSPRASDSSKVHTVLVVGETEGAVEDVMLGTVHASHDLTAVFKNYLYGSLSNNCSVLSSIIEPTPECPDRMVRISWDAVSSMSSTLDSVVKPRDFVMAVASGTTTNSTGERIGYMFFHSVDIESAPPLPQAIRATRHFTYLYRQISPDRMHVYILGRIDPKGRLLTGVTVRITSETVLEIAARIKRFSAIKKRTFLLNQQLQFPRASVGDFFPFSIPSEFTTTSSSGECTVCGKRASGLLSSGKPCVVCGKSTCSSCFKMGHVIVAGDKAKKSPASIKKLPFCTMCDQLAMQLNGWDLSVADVIAAREKDSKDVTASFSSTASCST